jgi:hypothetical protein
MHRDVTEAQVLAARAEHPERGARRLVRVLFPGLDDEREIVRLAAKVGRILCKHDAPAVRGTRAEVDEPVVEEDIVEDPLVGLVEGESTVAGHLQTVRADIAELRSSMATMKRDGSWQAYTGAMRLVQTLEEDRRRLEVEASDRLKPQDVTREHVVATLRRMPAALLREALGSSD